MKENSKKIITRFAPSPTGFMHIGGVRTAIYAFLFAKQNDGKFILRIEDTDKNREVEGSINHIKESLTWLGINWDEFYIQTDNLEKHKIEIQKLLKEEKAFESDGAIIFKMPLKKYSWYDEVRGKMEIIEKENQDYKNDFVILKKDGYPTYNIAHILDDNFTEVSHIMRGQEFIPSMPKFLALYEALNFEMPKFCTLPPILNDEGNKKLSKRDGAKDILDYKKEGYLAIALINWLVLIGWNDGTNKEIWNLEELIKSFDIKRIHKAGGRADIDKLNFINKEHIKMQTKSDQIKMLKEFLPKIEKYNENLLEKIRPIFLDRISFYGELKDLDEKGEFDFIFSSPKFDAKIDEDKIEKIIWKKSDKENTLINLNLLKNIFEKFLNLDIDDLENFENFWKEIYNLAEEKGKGDVLWPLRYSLSGKEKSIDPKNLIYILGILESLKRINFAIEKINQI